jgi:hypothetical protein
MLRHGPFRAVGAGRPALCACRAWEQLHACGGVARGTYTLQDDLPLSTVVQGNARGQ